jgi:hypothetical protein
MSDIDNRDMSNDKANILKVASEKVKNKKQTRINIGLVNINKGQHNIM